MIHFLHIKIKWNQLSEKQQEQRINEKAYADKNREYLPDKGWFIYKPIDRYKPN